MDSTMMEEAKIVVGIDFGTTFSGFAYALTQKTEVEKVYTFYDWPYQGAAGAKPYCKTQTSLWYLPGTRPGTFELREWGWKAHVEHCKALQSRSSWKNDCTLSKCGHFVKTFKLHLATSHTRATEGARSESEFDGLPDGLSVERCISDYLHHLSAFIMAELRNKFGAHIVKKDLQFTLTVPAIWDERAKQTMIECAQVAGLVQGPFCKDPLASLHPVVLVLEPEAASVYCQHKLTDGEFRKGSKFLVVDVGGGTVDLVLHQKVESGGVKVKEVACSTGGLCGGTFVDKGFKNFLGLKIGCFEIFAVKYPAIVLTITGLWENVKCSFDGQLDSYDLQLPAKLASAWERHDRLEGSWSKDKDYDELVITGEDMKSIFDGVVGTILKLIEEQLVPDLEAIMVVGGFSNSPYLMNRIRETFSSRVNRILCPPDPESAVCQGAVAFGILGAEIMMSRKSRKTYGISVAYPFQIGDNPEYILFNTEGKAQCSKRFSVFIRKGEDVPVNHKVKRSQWPISMNQKSILFQMFCTNDLNPKYVTDNGVSEVGRWNFPIPKEAWTMQDLPQVEITMYFGRTSIEMFAEPKNFEGNRISGICVTFERDLVC